MPKELCARITAQDPELTNSMWDLSDGDPGLHEQARALCELCPVRLDCLSRAVVTAGKDTMIWGGLDYFRRLRLRDVIQYDLGTSQLTTQQIRAWLCQHPDWPDLVEDRARSLWRRWKADSTLRKPAPRPRSQLVAVHSSMT